MSFVVLNILDALRDLGEDAVKTAISSFKCALNPEIQEFLQHKAIDFAKKKISITYLVFGEDNKIAAYFTITHKPTFVPCANFKLSNSQIKRLERFSVFNSANEAYHASAFLLAQFGKDTNYTKENTISGANLMNLVFNKLRDIQYLVGGGIVFLECEDNIKLLNFYIANNFKIYGQRHSADSITYHQLLCLL